MSSIQLELFEISEAERLKDEIRNLEKSLGNVRRGMFSRHDELEKKLVEARERNEKIEEALHQMTERMRRYEEALFPELGSTDLVAEGAESGLRSRFIPVSSLIMASQASSTGLSLPQK
jgi:Sec-independent protein translocase protein TatA